MTTPKIIYCTYFNKNYLLKGLALHASLVQHDPRAKLWILCMDDYTKDLLDQLSLAGVTTFTLADFEDKELKKAKSTRSLVEYYWTCTPSLPRYILKKNPGIDLVTYLDADLYFYSSPSAIYKELGNNSLYIVEHRYPKTEMYRDNVSGRFNVAVNVFRNDQVGKACINYWRAKCNEWCYLKEEPGRFGDQLYLNEWPGKFKKLVISQNLGVDAAPWNIAQYQVTRRQGHTYINQDQLIIYHFHQLEYYTPKHYEFAHGYMFTRPVQQYIYRPYIKALNQAYKLVLQLDPAYLLVAPEKPLSAKIKSTVSKYFGPLYWYLRGLWQ